MKHSVRRHEYRDAPARLCKGRGQIAYDIADATDFAAWKCAVLGRNKNYMLGTDSNGLFILARVVQLLAEHVWRNQCQAVAGYPKSALAIVVVVFADYCTGRDDGATIDDGAMYFAILANVDVGQHDTVINGAIGMHNCAREQQRIADLRARYQASTRDHRLNGFATAILMVKNEFSRRRLNLVREYRPGLIVEVELW